jgi:glycosyltransferase involved in cell wall biosynthesis
MKILVFTDWFYPGSQAGGPIQSLISLMKFSSDQFYVVTRNTDLNSTTPYPGIKSNTWQKSLQEKILVYYLNEKSLTENFIFNLYKELEPDRIYLNSMWSPKFTLSPLSICRKNGWSEKIVLAPRGMLKPAAFNQKGFKKRLFLFFAKANNTYGNICWHATSEIERNEILQLFPKAKIRIAPNISNATISAKTKEISYPFRILTVGRISPEKGYYEALETFRNWAPKSPVIWDIVGLKENAELVRTIQSYSKENTSIQITLHGHKNQDELNVFYENAHLFFLPTRGENYGHAIAEALSFGTPVVISDQTPWKNIEEFNAGKASPLNSSTLAISLNFFLNLSNETYRKWSDGAIVYAQEKINTESIIQKNKNLFNNLL